MSRKARMSADNKPIGATMKGYNVYLLGKWINKVFFTGYTADEVRVSLINHDGYDSRIVVREER